MPAVKILHESKIDYANVKYFCNEFQNVMNVIKLVQSGPSIFHQHNGYLNEEKCLELVGKTIKLKSGDDQKFVDCLLDDDSKINGKEKIVKLDFVQRFSDFFIYAPY